MASLGAEAIMRKWARLVGLAWMASAVISFAALWVSYATASVASGFYRGGYSLALVLFVLIVPGAALYRWGKGPFVPQPTSTDNLRPKAPYSLAQEMGHIARLESHPDSR